jgi:hypothetical protein
VTPDPDELERLRHQNADLRHRAEIAEEELASLRARQAQAASAASASVASGAGAGAGEADLRPILGPLHPVLDPVIALRLNDAEIENAALRLRFLGPPPPPAGISVQNLVGSIGLSAALGEATLADRALGTLSVSAQMMVVAVEQNSVSVQFPSPATPLPSDNLSTVTVVLDRMPAAAGHSDPPTLYHVLAAKQALYGGADWFASDQAKAIVAACTAALAQAAGWTFASVLSTADTVTTSEQSLAAALSARQPVPAGTPAYASAADASRHVIDGLKSASSPPVAADLAALCSALHNVTVAAAGVVP